MAGTSKSELLHSHFDSFAAQLKKAFVTYTESGGQGNPTFDTVQGGPAAPRSLARTGRCTAWGQGLPIGDWIGQVDVERILDVIFSTFCAGK